MKREWMKLPDQEFWHQLTSTCLGFVHYFFSLNSIMFMLPKIAAAGRMVSRVNGFGKFTRCFSQITVIIYESS